MKKADKAKATSLRDLIANDPEYAVGALMKLRAHQTNEEQAHGVTVKLNGVGFNSSDAGILTDLAGWYEMKHYLTERQVGCLHRKLPKYAAQLMGLGGVEPLPVSTRQPKAKAVAPVPKTATLTDRGIEIGFDYDSDLVAKIKTLPGRRWDQANKVWHVPRSVAAVELLLEHGFEVCGELVEWHKGLTAAVRGGKLEIPGLKGELFGFQKEGVRFVESREGRALIGDEPGLGKTIQALAWLQLHKEIYPVVIVVPASVKLNWKREIEKWMDDPRPEIAEHRSGILQDMSHSLISACQTRYIIINYDILAPQKEKYWICDKCKTENLKAAKCCSNSKCLVSPRQHQKMFKRVVEGTGWVDPLIRLRPKAVILDEVHYVKSSKADRTKAVVKLCKGVKHVIALSGTPIVNRPMEMFNALKIIQPGVFPSFWRYAQRYCGARHNGYGWDFSGATNTQELHDLLVRTIMVRRLKKDVLKDLPEKTRSAVPMELENKAVYREAEKDFVEWLRAKDKEKAVRASRAEALARIEGLKQLTIKGKIGQCIKWIGDFLETDQKLVAFCTHQNTVDQLFKAFPVCSVMITGRVTGQNRQNAIDFFQTKDQYQLAICNIKAGGVGINLYAASNVCFVELPWTPGDVLQAEDRVHRIGQKASSVNAWYLLAADTIEEEIAELLDKKRKVLSQVLDGKDVDEQSLLTELLDKYKKEK